MIINRIAELKTKREQDSTHFLLLQPGDPCGGGGRRIANHVAHAHAAFLPQPPPRGKSPLGVWHNPLPRRRNAGFPMIGN